MEVKALALNVPLCTAGDKAVHELIQHLRACEHCRREVSRILDGFPLARMFGASTMLDTIMKGNDHGGT